MFDIHDSGDFDKRIILQRVYSDRDAIYNQPVLVTENVATVWAKLTKVSTGSESFIGEQEQAAQRQGFMIKYSSTWSNINASWRVSYGGNIWFIYHVFTDQRRGYILFDAILRNEGTISET